MSHDKPRQTLTGDAAKTPTPRDLAKSNEILAKITALVEEGTGWTDGQLRRNGMTVASLVESPRAGKKDKGYVGIVGILYDIAVNDEQYVEKLVPIFVLEFTDPGEARAKVAQIADKVAKHVHITAVKVWYDADHEPVGGLFVAGMNDGSKSIDSWIAIGYGEDRPHLLGLGGMGEAADLVDTLQEFVDKLD